MWHLLLWPPEDLWFDEEGADARYDKMSDVLNSCKCCQPIRIFACICRQLMIMHCVITWSIFSKILNIKIPSITSQCKPCSVYCEFKNLYKFCFFFIPMLYRNRHEMESCGEIFYGPTVDESESSWGIKFCFWAIHQNDKIWIKMSQMEIYVRNL